MLQAKKMGHAVYSFQRKKDYFMRLNRIVINDNNVDNLFFILRKYILHQNMQSLSLFFQTLKMNEKYLILKNEQKIYQLFQISKWSKGQKLFDVVLKDMKQQLGK